MVMARMVMSTVAAGTVGLNFMCSIKFVNRI